MKKLNFLFTLLIAPSLTGLQAQGPTVHNPEIITTVTADQVRAWGAPTDQAASGVIALNFEGMGNLDEISQFYNGGTSNDGFSGKKYGVYFSNNALAIINAANGGSGNFISSSGSKTALFFLTGSGFTLSAPSGFTNSLSFRYTSSAIVSVSVYDGVDGTGNLLASQQFQPLVMGKKGGQRYFDNWKHSVVNFSGTAKSVTFSGQPDQCAFDDVTLGSESPGKNKGAAVSGQNAGGGTMETGTAALTGKALTEKGKWFLEGASRLGLSAGGSKSKSDGNVIDGSESKYFNFDIIPKAGYFFIDNLVGGLFMDFEIKNDRSKDESGYNNKETIFVIGPFARYYIPICDKLLPYAEGQVGFGIDNYKSKYGSGDWSKSKESVFTYRVGGGATYFINDIVGADLFLGYLHDSYKFKDSGDGSRSSGSKSVYGEFNMQIGIVVILGK